MYRWEVGLAVLQEEIIQFLLAFHLGAHLIDVYSAEIHSTY
jgi:hypothetical protein